jgi:site-specific recombinase XerC
MMQEERPMARPILRVLPGGPGPAPRSRFRDAYDWFRTEKQGDLVSRATLSYYDYQVLPLLTWLEEAHPEVLDFPDLGTDHLRSYRSHLTERDKKHGGTLQPESLLTSHKAIRTFLRWIKVNHRGVEMDPGLFELRKPRQPKKDALLFDISQLRTILGSCEDMTEEAVVRLAVGAGLREAELCGVCIKGPDGSPDLIPDPVEPGRWLIRVRWDAGAKGKKTRYVPISAKLAGFVKRYIATSRPSEVPYQEILISRLGRPFTTEGVKSLMERLKRRVGFRVHAHALRHTYATASVQVDVNLEKLRAAMGHEEYDSLLRYVKLASQRSLGAVKDWAEFIYVPVRSQER